MGFDPLVPDLAATPGVVRKRRAPKHDFKDGFGKIFAHRHDNGGGWVADTAYVAPGVKVTRNAQVFGYAKIYDECMITGQSMVYGRARLFDRVRVSQTARVFGNAVLAYDVQVEDSVAVCGEAHVLGSSRVSRRALISGNAFLWDTYVYGPTKRGQARISGQARVLDSRVYGLVTIEDAASLEAVTVRNCLISGSAKLIGGHYAADVTWQESSFLDHANADGVAQLSPNQDENAVLSDILRRRPHFEHTSINSTVSGSGFMLDSNVTLIGSRMTFSYYQNTNSLDRPDIREFFDGLRDQNIVFYNLEQAHSVEDLRRYLAAGTQPRPVTIPGFVPPPVNTVPNLDLVRQRRLMRLEGEQT